MDRLLAMTRFTRIVEKGSLTAAAAECGTSLPSMVRSLSALERHVGVSLLNRTTRRISLTDEGRQYHEQCKLILDQVQQADAALASRAAEPRGKLVVTASVMFGRRYIAMMLAQFMARHNRVTVELLFVDRVVNLVEEGVDVAIRIGPLVDSSLIAIPVGHVRRVVCGSPKYLRQHGTPRTPDDVRRHRVIRFTGLVPRSEWVFRSGGRRLTVPVESAYTCNQADSAIQACVNGNGLGVFLSYMVAPAKRARQLRYVLEDYEIDPLPVHLVYPRSRALSASVRAFVDACVSRLRRETFD
ncbi:MAG TPA: LysR family transcriptional regulator [Burkholderiales bacterium]|nr:LysR family transcriptional regulator [Burkholderiales bacterium]